MIETSEVTQFRIATATNCWRVNTLHERKLSFVSVCHVGSTSTQNILMRITYMQLVYIMGCDLVYGDLEGFLPFQEMHAENVQ